MPEVPDDDIGIQSADAYTDALQKSFGSSV